MLVQIFLFWYFNKILILDTKRMARNILNLLVVGTLIFIPVNNFSTRKNCSKENT